jgi:hypothetical protein
MGSELRGRSARGQPRGVETEIERQVASFRALVGADPRTWTRTSMSIGATRYKQWLRGSRERCRFRCGHESRIAYCGEFLWTNGRRTAFAVAKSAPTR